MIKGRGFKRIIIKLGSSVLIKDTGVVDRAALKSLAKQISALQKTRQIILVSSGAIGMGKIATKIKKPHDITEKQALAAVGQPLLMNEWRGVFRGYGVKVGQMLVTKTDLDYGKSEFRIRDTLLKLLELKVIPVINENDTVAVDEIKFGDNDMLSALVASKMDADLLIMLSDVEGLKDFKRGGSIVREVRNLSSGIRALAKNEKSAFGVGGFGAKIEAAGVTMKAGILTVIAKGSEKAVLLKIVKEINKEKKKTGTWFIPGKPV